MDSKMKEDADPRVDYIGSYVTKTFRIKSDKWQKLMMSEDKVTMTGRWKRKQLLNPSTVTQQTMIFDWLDDPKAERLCFGMGSSGGLMVFNNFPNTSKTKIVYFIRKAPISLTPKNIKNVRPTCC